ncbi:MAG TPA: glycosyltransferase family 4 protein [Chthoniobacterales bacterium]
MPAYDVGVVSVVPSPYQKDLFRAWASRMDTKLQVYYLEARAPDSPWPEQPLEPYETILPGFWLTLAGARFHVVTMAPRLARHRFLVLNSLTSSLAQALLRFRRPRQTLLFWAEALRDQGATWRARAQRLLSDPIGQADAVVAIGTRAQRSYRERFPGLRCFNVPYHCDLDAFRCRPNHFPAATEEVVFLFCGQMIARKGVDVLLQAFDRLVREGVRVRLRLAGRRADLEQMLDGVSTESRARIDYEGFIDPKRLPELFEQAHAFILPSRYDGWGVVINQALGAGLPIICSDAVGAGLDLVQPGVNGLIFPVGESAALAAAMGCLAREPARLASYGAASRQLAAGWTPDRGAEKWAAVLSEFSR